MKLISYKEMKRRSLIAATVYGSSTKFAVPDGTRVGAFYAWLSGGLKVVTGLSKGRFGAYIPKVIPPEVRKIEIKRATDMHGKTKSNAWNIWIDGRSTLREFKTAARAGQSCRDTCGARIGSFIV